MTAVKRCDQILILPSGLADLVTESEGEGFSMLRRLRDEWAHGENRFNRPGEALFGVFEEGRLVGVGGVNVDPYAADPGLARLRHLYVLAAWRRRGVGEALVHRIVSQAEPHFGRLRLWTGGAAAFYERLGFKAINESNATHAVVFGELR